MVYEDDLHTIGFLFMFLFLRLGDVPINQNCRP